MKRSRFNEEQIIAILQEQEAGAKTADVCRKHGISGATFYKWKGKFGGILDAVCERAGSFRFSAMEPHNVAKLRDEKARSEERRVGKEWRYRGAVYH